MMKYRNIEYIVRLSNECEKCGAMFELTYDMKKHEFGPYKKLTPTDMFELFDNDDYVYIILDKLVSGMELKQMVDEAIESYKSELFMAKMNIKNLKTINKILYVSKEGKV